MLRVWLTLIAWAASILLMPLFADSQRPVILLYSASANGILRACYCPNSPWGGLAKRAWIIDQIRSTVGADNVLLLDSGDLFPAESDTAVIPPLLHLYEGMRYDAAAIGDQELMNGPAQWLALQPRLPWLSSGYRLQARPPKIATSYLAKPWMFKTVAEIRVGILSVVGPEAFRFSSAKTQDLGMTDPIAMARGFLKANAGNMDLFVVLSHIGKSMFKIFHTGGHGYGNRLDTTWPRL